MKKLLINALSLALFTLAVSSCSQRATNSVNIATISITQDVKDDATYRVVEEIKKLKERGGNGTISFEKGTYHFYPEFAYEKFEFYSNHGDVLSRYGFYMNDMKNIIIDGNGSEFIFHGIMTPFLFENCENVEVKNITVDFLEPFHSQGVVVATNPRTQSFDMKMSEDYPYEIRNGKLIFLKSYYEHQIGMNNAFDPKTGRVAYQSNVNSIPYGGKISDKDRFNADNFSYKNMYDLNNLAVVTRGKDDPTRAEAVEPGVVRLFIGHDNLPKVGWIMGIKNIQRYGRFAPGIKFEDTKDIKLNSLAINHTGGMGFLFENSENIDMYKCSTVPSCDRIVSVTADATHFVGCRGNISMRSCTYQNQLDDGINVHGAYQVVEKIIDKHTLGLHVGHHQQLGFIIGKAGDTMGIIDNSKEIRPHHTLTLESVKRLNGSFMVVRFKEELPEDVKAGYVVENLSAYPEVLIEDCHFSGNRARAILISTPRKTVIRNNFMGVEMEGILLIGGPCDPYWFESGQAANVTIEGNTFDDCATSTKPCAAIRLVDKNDKYNDYFVKNVNIIGNTFNQYDNFVMSIWKTDGLNVEGNIFNNSGTFPQRDSKSSAIKIGDSKNISFKDNKYNGKATKIVEYMDDKTPHVEFK
ncbi:MAG: right-handed parallel beta-helix repeat-containing protein [Rikenellaceae bacterium]